MTWEQGRNLKTATNSTTNTTVVSANKVDTEISQAYTYDADGIRTGKTSTTKIYKYSASTGGGVASVGDNVSEPNAISYVRYLYSTVTTAHSYITQNGKVVRETIGSGTTAKVLDFIYDESGKPFALRYTNGTASPVTYYYVLNLQGDVVGLLNSSGTLVVRYDYNAWGEIISVTNAAGTAITSSTHIANLNPLRYRGYYYDTETGFYYLQSRYYDPVTHRFINADSYASTDVTDAISCNMFAYCANNPVCNIDPEGTFFKKALKWFTAGVIKPVTDWVQQGLSHVNLTYSNNLTGTVTLGYINYGGQISCALDTQGNIAIQGSLFAGGTISTSADVSLSATSSQMLANAPDVSNLAGPGHTGSVAVSAQIPYQDFNGTTSINSHVFPDQENGTYYKGYSLSNGISYPASEASLSYSYQYSNTSTLWKINAFKVLNKIYAAIERW